MQPKRRRYTDATGERRLSADYSVRFVDHQGVRRRLRLFKQRSASEQFVRRLERLIEAKAGGESLDRELMSWIGQMPKAQLEKLIEFRLIDPRRISSAIPIHEHITAWRRSIANEGRTPLHLNATVTRVVKVFSACGIQRWSDIDARVVADWLADQTGEEKWSIRTHNSHVQSVKQFTRWMVTHEHALLDPLVSLKVRSQGTGERRRARRALSADEARRLVHAAEDSPREVQGVDGPTRGLLYRVAFGTGLRYGELCRLEVGWIQFGRLERGPGGALQYAGLPTRITPPAVATKAGRKSGRVDTIVVPAELHLRLERACAGKHPKARVFARRGPRSGSSPALPASRGVELVKADLAAAGIRYVDEAGRVVDFHSLRHTALTLFAAAGASYEVMLALSRHSDPKVTKEYLHSELVGRAQLLSKLPSLDLTADRASIPKAVGAENTGALSGPFSESSTLGACDVMGSRTPQNVRKWVPSDELQSIALPLGYAASEATSVAGDEGVGEVPTQEVGGPGAGSADPPDGAWGQVWATEPAKAHQDAPSTGAEEQPESAPGARTAAAGAATRYPFDAAARLVEGTPGLENLAELIRAWPKFGPVESVARILAVRLVVDRQLAEIVLRWDELSVGDRWHLYGLMRESLNLEGGEPFDEESPLEGGEA